MRCLLHAFSFSSELFFSSVSLMFSLGISSSKPIWLVSYPFASRYSRNWFMVIRTRQRRKASKKTPPCDLPLSCHPVLVVWWIPRLWLRWGLRNLFLLVSKSVQRGKRQGDHTTADPKGPSVSLHTGRTTEIYGIPLITCQWRIYKQVLPSMIGGKTISLVSSPTRTMKERNTDSRCRWRLRPSQ